MNEADAQNCWEFWNCDPSHRDTCLAFTTNSGDSCWDLVGSLTRHPVQCRCAKQQDCFEFCWQCPWFKKLNPEFGKNQG